ncbi:RDD family protein [Brevibacterium ravenspurgense]|uniref:RDD family protein n=1 Tax=Brevibacterium ravenspurgense TaxID=479117 RepID=UPI001EF17863|nr:RDD family protein [Brevibacterium ravenspurgense]
MFDRDSLGSWLQGPKLEEGTYAGQRLGLPETGPGSTASLIRRVGSLFIDWALCALIARWLAPDFMFAPHLIFVIESLLLQSLLGYTIGQRICGVRIINRHGRRPNPLRLLIRIALQLLIIPGLLYNPDNRGLHDLAADTAVVRI